LAYTVDDICFRILFLDRIALERTDVAGKNILLEEINVYETLKDIIGTLLVYYHKCAINIHENDSCHLSLKFLCSAHYVCPEALGLIKFH
jgi:hypothetical protein